MHSNQLSEAAEKFESILAYDPDNVEAAINLSFIYLKFERYTEGWKLFDRRLDFIYLDPTICPLWEGQPDCSLLVQSDAGIGDAIQMFRYFPVLKKMNVRIIFQGAKMYHGIIKANFNYVKCIETSELEYKPDAIDMLLVDQSEICVDTDYHIALTSLPRYLGQFHAGKYISNELLDNGKIGICWQGNQNNTNDGIRSILLEEMIPMFETGKQFVSLQQHLTNKERDILRDYDVEVPPLVTLEQTASVIAGLHEVVTVDTSVAHLAGAIGKKTKNMIYFCNDWRWLIDRTDSPWYPSMTLYRQPMEGDWKSVIDRVTAEL